MFCFHKYSKVENGYQYCKKCGIAIAVPCTHSWKEYQYYNIIHPKTKESVGSVLISKCERCGEIKKDTIVP